MSPILQSRGGVSARGFGHLIPAAIGGAFESIASASGTGSSGTITFSSIPGTYQHLQIRMIARNNIAGTGIDEVWLRFNSDTASNYSDHSLSGTGTAASAIGNANTTFVTHAGVGVENNATAGIMGVSIVDIHDYASTTKNKTVRALIGDDRNGSGTIRLASGLWRSTSAITSISLISAAGNFTTATSFALYGIKGA